MKRRAVLVGAASLAVVAGAGSAWWRSTRADDARVAVPDFWTQSFQSLDGSALQMASWRGRPLVLNFWATWCVPCVTEMPLLDQFARERAAAGWRVLALAVDRADPVRRFVAERVLRLPVALAGADGIDLSRAMGNTVGALPFSVAFDSAGKLRERKLGALTPELLAAWVADIR